MKSIPVLIKKAKGQRNVITTAHACPNHLSVSNMSFQRPNVKRAIRCVSLETDSTINIGG